MQIPKSKHVISLLSLNFAVVLLYGLSANAQDKSKTIVPLPNAHAHNDYEQNRPLLDALDQGFCSVEADIFLVGDQLVVGHFKWTLNKKNTLRKLYLDPLQARVNKNGGRVFKDGPPFTLLIDIKENGDAVYPALSQLLNEYQEMLSGLRNNTYQHKAVQVVISGACPRRLIKADKNRLVAIDGRLSDLDSDAPKHLIPMISAPWGSNFKWRGRSELPKLEKQKLADIVNRAHAKDRRVRFWASPESENVWEHLHSIGIDHINTDQLERLQKFLTQKQRKK